MSRLLLPYSGNCRNGSQRRQFASCQPGRKQKIFTVYNSCFQFSLINRRTVSKCGKPSTLPVVLCNIKYTAEMPFFFFSDFIFFSYLFNFMYMSTLFLSADTSEEGIGSHRRWLWATMWLLGIGLRTSRRAVSALNHWAISPAQGNYFLRDKYFTLPFHLIFWVVCFCGIYKVTH